MVLLLAVILIEWEQPTAVSILVVRCATRCSLFQYSNDRPEQCCNKQCFVYREVKVTESSESVLAGTKRPPFRMVVRAVSPNGSRLNVRAAVSEEFVVVTTRTKNLKKQEIPSLDDPISKLNHIGKETVKKLNEIKASADEMNLDLKLPRELWR